MSNRFNQSFSFKNILSFITERKKLLLIMYNKQLQNSLNINLINYKIKSGKYKIGEKNGEGKEYNKEFELIFEGEYLNKKKNGKGREYDEDGTLKFEGEYLNGERNGKGKEYYITGEIKFVGEFLNGKNGKALDMIQKGILYIN